ncbi:hypothetical protein [Nonomuraea sp. JJY05]|jgi:hypothetical protein
MGPWDGVEVGRRRLDAYGARVVGDAGAAMSSMMLSLKAPGR